MILIKNPARATISISKRLTKKEEESLAGDIENWFMREKSIITEVNTKWERS